MNADPNLPPSGEELYRRFEAGDARAMEELVALYADGLISFLYHILHDVWDAEELAIDAFARLAAGGYGYQSSVKTYLYTIARNLAYKHLKKHRHHKHLSLQSDIHVDTYTGSISPPEKSMLHSEQNQLLRTAMKSLKPEYRQVLHLLYFEDMTYAEAARILRKSARQIGDLSYRARDALKRRLKGEGFIYEEL